MTQASFWIQPSLIYSGMKKHALVAACACMSVPAVAIAATVPAPESHDLEQLLNTEVVTASRLPQPLSEAPATVYVITRDEIEAFGYRNLDDVLRAVRGIHITNDLQYSYAAVTGIIAPGDYNSRILVMLDGLRLNDAIYQQGPLGWTFPVEMNAIERVEFVYGPGSSLYGSNAAYGVLNIITRKQADNEIRGTIGNYRLNQLQGSATLNLRNDGNVSLWLGRMNRNGPDLSTPENVTPDTESSERVMLSWRQDGWDGKLVYGDRHKQLPILLNGTSAGNSKSYTHDDYLIAALARLDSTALQGNLCTQLSHSRHEYHGTYYDADVNGGTIITHDEAGSTTWDLESVWSTQHWANHQVLLGAEFSYAPNVRQTVEFEDEPSLLNVNSPLRTTSFFAQDEWHITPQSTLNTGLRYDHSNVYAGKWSPKIAVLHKLSDALSMRLSHSQSFRQATAFERDYLSASVIGRPAYAKNKLLVPETLRREEIAVDYAVSPKLKITTQLSNNHWQQQIVQVINDNAQLQYQNLYRTRAQTLQLGLEAVNALGKWKFDISRQKVVDETNQLPLSNSPKLIAQAQWSGQLYGKLNAGVQTIYVSPRLVNVATGSEVASVTLINAALSWKDIVPSIDLRLSAFNLLNRRYADPIDESFTRDRAPQDGRALQLGLSWRPTF